MSPTSNTNNNNTTNALPALEPNQLTVLAFRNNATIESDFLNKQYPNKIHWITAAEVQNFDAIDLGALASELQQKQQYLAVKFNTSHFDDWRVYEYPARMAMALSAQVLPCTIIGSIHHQSRYNDTGEPIISGIKLSAAFGKAISLSQNSALSEAAFQVLDAVLATELHSQLYDETLLTALLRVKKIYGKNRVVLDDVRQTPMDYKTLFKGAFALGNALTRITSHKDNVGVLLPSSGAAVVAILALQAYERTPAILNFSAGIQSLTAAIETAELKVVLTSKAFIQKAELTDVIEALSKHAKIVYLEDVRKSLSLMDKIKGAIGLLKPEWLVPKGKGTDTAAILFTSGSEGTPKGVVLSHNNFLANRLQVLKGVHVTPNDVMFNALPIFHSFGLTVGVFTPLLCGAKTYLYPSPLHYKIIIDKIEEHRPTIFLSTDTFLKGYARIANEDSFSSIRLLVCGAEKVRDDTRAYWKEKYNIDILEGYGATECTPVISANTPIASKPNSVGRPLAGIEYKLRPVEGISKGGKLVVKGPNVMSGYLRYDNKGVIEPPEEGWYDTGDIVEIDGEGYITIQGRAKRFAKIGGEMVSLTAVEDLALHTWPNIRHAAVSIPDPKKGEKIILVTEHTNAKRTEMMEQAKATGFAELGVPKTFHYTEEVPVLNSGKTDYVKLQKIVEAELSN
jgi:acyl-[acyl-carrier-protein]-phospholipid O-acyltransferase/long-chain-fatty-acid--[acyl-carrier-protein] ligase